jgi:DNA sulfur modification protein DndD
LRITENSLETQTGHTKRWGGALYENRNALESEKIAAEEQRQALKGKCMLLAASELPLALVEPLLRKVEQTASTEQAAALSRAMADELLIRDRELLALARKTSSNADWIRKIEAFMRKDQECRKKQAEATDAYLMLSQDTHESVKHLLSRGIDRATEEARTVTDTMAVVQERIRDAEARLAMLPDSERIAEIIDRRTKLKVALMNAETHVKALDEEIATLSRMIEEQTARIDHLLEQGADEEHEKATAHRLVAYADKVSGTLERFQEMFLERHLKGLAQEIGACFAILLRKKRLIESIRIAPKTLHVELIGRQGRIIPPEKLSAGERQLLAVSMVWGLSRASGRPIPAVIDTPLGRLDSTHRRHLVDRYFPCASHQVILLSTDEEIDEAYHKALASRTSREFRVCFDEKTHSSRIEPGYFW